MKEEGGDGKGEGEGAVALSARVTMAVNEATQYVAHNLSKVEPEG